MQAAYMHPSAVHQPTWRPRIDPSNISTANTGMPPHPPQGYQGSWPPPQLPPGYPGPPPAQLPPSVSANQWEKGRWRFDAKAVGWSSASGAPPQQPQQYYNPGVVNNNVPRPPSQQAGGPPGWAQTWVAHGWQMPADHNPYKRIPKEPDPSYFSVELSKNPLGLENMHITRASRPQEKPFTTPWRWVPEDLPPSDDEGDEPTPPSSHRPSSRDDPSSTAHHHISTASRQAAGFQPQDPMSHQYSSSREAEQYLRKGVKSPPIRESDQHRSDTQPPQTTTSSSRDGHVSSSSTTAYPSSRNPAQEHTPSKDPPFYRSSRRDAQGHTPPSDSSPSSRRNPQGYTPPSEDQRQPPTLSQAHTYDERERGREKEKERRKATDSDGQDHEAFSGKQKLYPTFSPAIVRTPKYYSERTSSPVNITPSKPSSTRRASDGPGGPPPGTLAPSLTRVLQESIPCILSPLIGATPRPSSSTMPNVDKVSRGELSSSSSSSSPSSRDRSSRSQSRNHSRSSSLSKADDKSRRSLQRSDTITSRTMSPTRYDERSQPPTYYSNPSSSSMQQSSRNVGRSQTFPSLGPVSENPYSSIRRDSLDSRESRNPPPSISRASDVVKDLVRSNGRTVGRSYTDPHPSYNPARASSPLRTRSPTRALSPPRSATPSRSSSRAPSRSHTPTSTATIVPPGPVPPLPSDASRRYRRSSGKVLVRRGYWNKRGDCLTPDRKHFVRAPAEHQNPPEFSHYYENFFFRYDGKRIPWTTDIKESPDSLHIRGRQARYPFESYLQRIEVDEADIWSPSAR